MKNYIALLQLLIALKWVYTGSRECCFLLLFHLGPLIHRKKKFDWQEWIDYKWLWRQHTWYSFSSRHSHSQRVSICWNLVVFIYFFALFSCSFSARCSCFKNARKINSRIGNSCPSIPNSNTYVWNFNIIKHLRKSRLWIESLRITLLHFLNQSVTVSVSRAIFFNQILYNGEYLHNLSFL